MSMFSVANVSGHTHAGGHPNGAAQKIDR